MKTLHLTLKKKWFDMIASGEKKEEYREIKPYWIKRLFNADFGTYDLQKASKYIRSELEIVYLRRDKTFVAPAFSTIVFKNGYSKDAPTMIVECKYITTGKAEPQWSDNWQGEVFIIKLGDIIQKSV